MKSAIPERGYRQLRKGRCSRSGAAYFVTTCCLDKRRVFDDAENVRIVFDTLDWLVQQNWIDLHFCIAMPDHIHLVLQLTGDRTLSAVVKSLKQYSGRKIKERTGPPVGVWQENFYDHEIRRDESLHEIVKYCWLNPVRKGLVEDPHEYPHWRSKYEL